MRSERDQAREEKSLQEIDKIREDRRKHREPYANKREIPQMLLDLDLYLVEEIARQKINAKKLQSAMWRPRQSIFICRLMFLGVVYQNPYLRKKLVNTYINLVVGFASSLNVMLKEDKAGTLVLINKERYREQYQQIVKREIELPSPTVSKIHSALSLSIALNCLRLFDPERSYWKSVKTLKCLQRYIVYVRNALYDLSLKLDTVRANLLAEISQDIEKFLIGE